MTWSCSFQEDENVDAKVTEESTKNPSAERGRVWPVLAYFGRGKKVSRLHVHRVCQTDIHDHTRSPPTFFIGELTYSLLLYLISSLSRIVRSYYLAMFSICRRGPASISKVFRAAASTTRIPSTRPSTLSLALQQTSWIPSEARWLHVSSTLRNQATAQQVQDDGTTHKPRDVTKFQELIDHNMVHPNVIEQITKHMGHENMTEVQSMTINHGLQGIDM